MRKRIALVGFLVASLAASAVAAAPSIEAQYVGRTVVVHGMNFTGWQRVTVVVAVHNGSVFRPIVGSGQAVVVACYVKEKGCQPGTFSVSVPVKEDACGAGPALAAGVQNVPGVGWAQAQPVGC
jgi:hypothetical protein